MNDSADALLTLSSERSDDDFNGDGHSGSERPSKRLKTSAAESGVFWVQELIAFRNNCKDVQGFMHSSLEAIQKVTDNLDRDNDDEPKREFMTKLLDNMVKRVRTRNDELDKVLLERVQSKNLEQSMELKRGFDDYRRPSLHAYGYSRDQPMVLCNGGPIMPDIRVPGQPHPQSTLVEFEESD